MTTRGPRGGAPSRGRRPAHARRTTGTGPPPKRKTDPVERRTAITTRAAILGVVLCVLALALTVPLRQYLGQRGAVAKLRAEQAARQRRVDALEARKQQLQDPAYVEQLARERLHFVKPGEVPYILLTPAPSPTPVRPGTPGGTNLGGDGPWYSRLWGTVQSAAK